MEIISFFTENSSWLGEQFGNLFQAEVMKMTLAFLIAAGLHRRWVKKDMAEQFALLTKSIDNVADKLTSGLAMHTVQIENLKERVEEHATEIKNLKDKIH